MELRDVRLALRRYWVLAAAVLGVCLALGLAGAFLPAKTYRVRALVSATTRPGVEGAIGNVAAYEIPSILSRISSPPFVESVRADLDADVAGESVRVLPANTSGTGLIYVVVEGRNGSAIAVWANALAESIVEEVNEFEEGKMVLQTQVPAFPTNRAVSPQPTPILLGTTLLGLFAAVLAAVGASRIRQALDVAEEVRIRLDAPVLGQIPPIRRLQKGNESIAELLGNGPPELIEAFQSLRTNVGLYLLDEKPPAIAIASWTAGEGKSTVAAGLAVSLAAVGRDVVLIDADLRRPTQHLRLGEPFGEGLADLGRVDVDKVLRRTRYEHLLYLPAGIPDRHPADVVSVTLTRAHSQLAGEDRLLIIDAPPLHGVAETPLVLAVAHYVILVVDASSVKLVELEQAVARLRQSGLQLLGVVINRVRRTRQAATYDSYVVKSAPVYDGNGDGTRMRPARRNV